MNVPKGTLAEDWTSDLEAIEEFIEYVETQASRQTLARGERYHLEHRISHITKENSTWMAIARGNYLYKVRIDVRDDFYSCNCPADAPCKHVYAFGLSLRYHLLKKLNQEKNAKNIEQPFPKTLPAEQQDKPHTVPDASDEKQQEQEKNHEQLFLSCDIDSQNMAFNVHFRNGEHNKKTLSSAIFFRLLNKFPEPWSTKFPHRSYPLIHLAEELEFCTKEKPRLYLNNTPVSMAGTIRLRTFIKKITSEDLEGFRKRFLFFSNSDDFDMESNMQDFFTAIAEEKEFLLWARIELPKTLQKKGWQREGNLLLTNNMRTKLMLPALPQKEFLRDIALSPLPVFLSREEVITSSPLFKKEKTQGLESLPEIFQIGPLPVIKVEGEIVEEKKELKALHLQLFFAYTDQKISVDNKYQVLEKAAFCLPLNYSKHRQTVVGEVLENGVGVLRKLKQEKKFLQTTPELPRFTKKGSLRLGLKKIFPFFRETLPQLQELGVEVHIPEELASLKIKQKSFFLNLTSSGMNWFEGEITSEDFSKEDMRLAIEAARQNRESVCLRDGRWIRVGDLQLDKIFAALASLGVRSNKEGSAQKINMGKAVALLQEDVVREKNLSKQTQKRLFQWAGKEDFDTPPILKIHKDFLQKLRSYQKEGVGFMLQRHNASIGGILADDMGLGKTIQGIAFLSSIYNMQSPAKRENIKFLIVAPPAALSVWRQEIMRFCPSFPWQLWHGKQRKHEQLLASGVIITSYITLQKDIALFSENLEFETILIDEAQYLKNHQSVSGKTIRKLQARTIFCLTGTPLENHPVEIWSLMDIILPGLLGTLKSFRSAFSSGYKQEQIESLRRRISPFLLRRTRSAVLKDLPERNEQNIFSVMTAKQTALYESLRQEAIAVLGQAGKNYLMTVLPYLIKLRRTACHPHLGNANINPADSGKILQFMDMADELEESSNGILVFSQFTDMLDVFEKVLQKRGRKFFRLDGSVSMKKREKIVAAFQEQNDVLYFLISLRAGGTALTLHRADTVLHLDPWWNPAVEEQATARAHRMGQKNSVFVYKFFSEKSVEKKVLSLQEKKRQLFNDLLNQDSNHIQRFSRDDILEILQKS